MEYQEFSGKSINDCITEACTTLGVPSDRLDYEVVSEGSVGFMGIGAKKAVINARIKDENAAAEVKAEAKEEKKEAAKETAKEAVKETVKEDKPAKTESKKADAPKANKEEKAVKVKIIPEDELNRMKTDASKFLTDVLSSMGITAQVTCDYVPEDYTFNIDLKGDDMGVLIGRRGQTLDSLQYLVSLIVNKGTAEYVRVKVDTENYRSRRKDTLENLAKNMAFKVKRTRRPVSLEPMNPYERRIIHSALQNDRYVTTHSEGDEPFRKVIITLKK